MYILGISCYFHDAAAALLQDGVLVAAAEEERFTRRKHDASFPRRAIQFCLEHAGITGEELDYVVFYEKPLMKFSRIWRTGIENFPRSIGAFARSMPQWLSDRLWIKNRLVGLLGVAPNRVLFVEHHLSHAASAFFCSPFDESAILTVDGVGEWTTAGVGRARADWGDDGTNSLKLDQEIRFPHSLGLLYSAFTSYLGFRVNSDEYKVMGMAPYGEPTFLEKIRPMISVSADGSFELDMKYFSYAHSTASSFSSKFVDALGLPPREPEREFFTPKTHPGRNGVASKQNQQYADVAASIQRLTEDVLLKMARHALSQAGSRNLCMAGGVALNSVANGRILRETLCERLYIQPAAGDSGGALGAALYAYHVLLGEPRKFVQEHAYYGKEYTPDEVKVTLDRSGIQYTRIDDDEQLVASVAAALVDGDTVGWFQGRFEWGPRALGNRSILADPRKAEMKDTVNVKIKFREPFRPFAPAVLEEHAEQYFDLGGSGSNYPARFMLLVAPVVPDKQGSIPAVTHVDGSGRLQTISRKFNPRYYGLIEKFAESTGVPVLLNTSFNLRTEPIVTSPSNAVATFGSSGLDLLVLENFLVRK